MSHATNLRVQTNGITLNVASAGPDDGQPVILLHGFPDASFGWEGQIEALSGAGFRVIAPDQRGYHLSDKPAHPDDYGMRLLVADILGLADALDLGSFNLAGHDFGGIVAWNLAEAEPDRVRRLAILNSPHPRAMREFLAANAEQRRRSWYVVFFRLPRLPELVVRAGNWRPLTSAMSDKLTAAQLDRYRQAWSQPGAMKAMINWYRSLLARRSAPRTRNLITPQTLIIWGKQDPHLMWQVAAPSAALCRNARIEYVEDAGHWVHQDRPALVNQLLIDFFQGVDTGPA